MKTHDKLKQLTALQRELTQEATELERRAAEIRAKLNGSTMPINGTHRPQAQQGKQMPLREAIIQVTRGNPMKPDEIVPAVLAIGYRFKKTTKPLSSVRSLIYTKEAREWIVNQGGKFSPRA